MYILTIYTLLLLGITVLVLSDTITVPLSHNNAQASRFQVLDDQLASVETVTKYKRDNTDKSVPLAGNSVMVTCDIAVGSSKSPFTVLLDTGSPLLAIPTPDCDCDSGAPHAPYQTSSANAVSCSDNSCNSCCKSGICDTNNCAFSIVYADGTSISGGLYTDEVELGGLNATITFGGITVETSGFVAPYADGILGFSQDGGIACSPSCYPPIFSVFVSNGLVQNSFGIHLDYEGTGELTLGSVDTSTVTGSLYYTPLLERTNYYAVKMNSVKINGDTVVSSMRAILDTGTTYITLPRIAYNSLVAYFRSNHCDLVGTCSTNNIFNNNCLLSLTNVQAYPDLQFEFNGVEVVVSPNAYFLPTTLRGQQAYCFGVGHWTEDYAILGYSFMRGYYIYYDIQNSKIGFYGTNATAIASSPTNASSALLPSSLLIVSLLIAMFFW